MSSHGDSAAFSSSSAAFQSAGSVTTSTQQLQGMTTEAGARLGPRVPRGAAGPKGHWTQSLCSTAAMVQERPRLRIPCV